MPKTLRQTVRGRGPTDWGVDVKIGNEIKAGYILNDLPLTLMLSGDKSADRLFWMFGVREPNGRDRAVHPGLWPYSGRRNDPK